MAKTAEWKGNKDFDELYKEIIETKRKVAAVEQQIVNLANTLQYYIVNQNEIEALEEDVKIYQSIGRMFIVQEKKYISDYYEKRENEIRQQIHNLGVTKHRLQVHQNSKTDNLREIIQAHKEQSKNNDN